MIRIFTYWYNFIKELRLIYKYRKAALSLEKDLAENKLRVDRLGRIYTVINLPAEVVNQTELMQQSYVLSQLSPITTILMKFGMADSSFPEIKKIEGADAYLLILWPERDYVDLEVFLINSLVTTIVSVIIYYAIKWTPWAWLIATIKNFHH
jgi:hypothetical protein